MDLNKTIRAILVDDHPIVLNGLKSLLGNIPDIEIVAEANDGESALSLLYKNQIDLVISDISMPGIDGIELTKRVKKDFPETKVILLTAFNEREILKLALFSGAEACLIKNTSKRELLSVIYKVLDNGYYYCDNILEIARNIQPEAEPVIEETVELSDRELEVLELLLQGLANKEVADKLNISFHTVTSHRKNIMKKTRSNNISSLHHFAKKNKLFPLLYGKN